MFSIYVTQPFVSLQHFEYNEKCQHISRQRDMKFFSLIFLRANKELFNNGLCRITELIIMKIVLIGKLHRYSPQLWLMLCMNFTGELINNWSLFKKKFLFCCISPIMTYFISFNHDFTLNFILKAKKIKSSTFWSLWYPKTYSKQILQVLKCHH